MANLKVRIGADAKNFRRGMWQVKKISAQTSEFITQNFKRVGAGVAVGLALAARQAGKFKKQMAEVNTLLDDGNIKQLEQDVLDLASSMGIDTTDATKALYQALSAGVPSDNVIDFLQTATKTSIAGVTDLETAVDGLTSVINAYGSDIEDTSKISDLFFTIMKEGKITVEEISDGIGKVAPIAKAAGADMETLSAAIATLVQVEKPERAFTALRQAFALAAKEGKSLMDFLADFEGASLEKIVAAGIPKRTASAIAILTSNFDELNSQLGKARNSSGATEKAFQKMTDTAAFQFSKLKSTAEVALIEIGRELLPELARGIENLSKFIQRLRDDGSLQEFGKKAAIAISKLANIIENTAQTVAKYKGELATLGLTVAGVALMTEATIKLAQLKKALIALNAVAFVGGGGSASVFKILATDTKVLVRSLGVLKTSLISVGSVGATAFAGWHIGKTIAKLTGLNELMADTHAQAAKAKLGFDPYAIDANVQANRNEIAQFEKEKLAREKQLSAEKQKQAQLSNMPKLDIGESGGLDLDISKDFEMAINEIKRRISAQELINKGKETEAKIQQKIFDLEEKMNRKLSEQEKKRLTDKIRKLEELQNLGEDAPNQMMGSAVADMSDRLSRLGINIGGIVGKTGKRLDEKRNQILKDINKSVRGIDTKARFA